MGFNSRWGSIVSIFVFDWGSINIFMGWGCNQEWGSNGADTVDDYIQKLFKNFKPRYIVELVHGVIFIVFLKYRIGSI